MIFVDTNVLVDVLEHDPLWSSWSRQALAAARSGEGMMTNHIVIAELASHFAGLVKPSDLLEGIGVAVVELDMATAVRAGLAHREYRRRGGARTSILPDFLIAAHAETRNAPLLTRDLRRIGSYFPELTLITPETTHD